VGGHGTAASKGSLAKRVRNRDAVYRSINARVGCTRGRWPLAASRQIRSLNNRFLEPRLETECEPPLCDRTQWRTGRGGQSRKNGSLATLAAETREDIDALCHSVGTFCGS